jgi:hypothetical protein
MDIFSNAPAPHGQPGRWKIGWFHLFVSGIDPRERRGEARVVAYCSRHSKGWVVRPGRTVTCRCVGDPQTHGRMGGPMDGPIGGSMGGPEWVDQAHPRGSAVCTAFVMTRRLAVGLCNTTQPEQATMQLYGLCACVMARAIHHRAGK